LALGDNRSHLITAPSAPLAAYPIRVVADAGLADRALASAVEDRDFRRWGYLGESASGDESVAFVRRCQESRAAGAAVFLAVLLDGTSTPVGLVDVAVIDREQRWGECGYWVQAEHRGRGIGSAALGVVSEWALSRQLSRLDLPIHPDNRASIATALAAGYTYRGVCVSPHGIGGSQQVELYSRFAA
jgi:RimJ/RimL family protein N-acetyltransferase